MQICTHGILYTRIRIEQNPDHRTRKCFLYYPLLGFRFPMSQPQRLSSLTTLGVTAAVNGTRRKIKLLWIAYASASCVHMPEKGLCQRSVVYVAMLPMYKLRGSGNCTYSLLPRSFSFQPLQPHGQSYVCLCPCHLPYEAPWPPKKATQP